MCGRPSPQSTANAWTPCGRGTGRRCSPLESEGRFGAVLSSAASVVPQVATLAEDGARQQEEERAATAAARTEALAALQAQHTGALREMAEAHNAQV